MEPCGGWMWLLRALLVCQAVRSAVGKMQLCDVESGQTNIIVDIEESRGSCKY